MYDMCCAIAVQGISHCAMILELYKNVLSMSDVKVLQSLFSVSVCG
jgi:hypothetical protein